MTARVEWNDAAFLQAVSESVGGGLDAGALVVERRATINLNRQGVFAGSATKQGRINAANRLARAKRNLQSVLSGSRTFESFGKQSRRDIDVAANLSRIGDVDRAGGMPRKRTGTLAGSITFEPDGPLKRRVGPNDSVPYARIHELGGPTKGGRPYLIIKGQFIPLGKDSKARPMGYTKPYNMPARPYMRPSLIQSRAEIHKQFADVTRALMARKGYA